jgi:hypothetical protein
MLLHGSNTGRKEDHARHKELLFQGCMCFGCDIARVLFLDELRFI